MNDQQPIPPRSRLKELLAIPERQRTDAQWEEINDLEITLASANRAENNEPNVRRNSPVADDRQKSGVRPPQGKKPFKKFHKRPPKENTPT